MAVRRRKVRRLRGSRTHGWGVSGQHRKSGMRGGHGLSGRFRHKKSAVIAGILPPIGKKGFTPVQPTVDIAISVGAVSELLATLSKKVAIEEHGGKIVVDLGKAGYSKLLGDGELTKPLTIRVRRASESAIKKVEQAGGVVELLTKATA